METPATVAVVGLGPLGLVTLKNLLEEGLDATGFDKAHVVGGLWNFRDDDQTTVLESTISNVSKQRGCFTDFPFSKDTPTYPEARHVQEYLRDYADHFGFGARMRLGTEVLAVEHDEASGRWRVETRMPMAAAAAADHDGGGEDDDDDDKHNDSRRTVEWFDKVVLATGINNKPVVPHVDGIEGFAGEVLHSSGYKRPASLKGKTVLIVGFSNSAADTATTLVGHAKHVYISRRHDAFVLPRLVDGKPLDHGFNHRKTLILSAVKACLPASVADAMMRRVLTATHRKACPTSTDDNDNINDNDNDGCQQQQQPRLDLGLGLGLGLDLASAPLPSRAPPIISDSILQELLTGRVELVRALRRVDGPRAVLLRDGRRLDDVDAIVFCTGYQADFSLVPPSLDPTRDQPPAWTAAAQGSGGSSGGWRRLPRLYRNVFSLELPGSLAFMGCVAFASPAFQLYDVASMALARVWAGKVALPPRARMVAAVDAQQAWLVRLAQDGGGSVIPGWVDGEAWMAWADDAAGLGVASRLGYGLAGWSFWARDRHLCNLLMDGVFSPHVYRLFETGKRKAWPGARDEILRINGQTLESS